MRDRGSLWHLLLLFAIASAPGCYASHGRDLGDRLAIVIDAGPGDARSIPTDPGATGCAAVFASSGAGFSDADVVRCGEEHQLGACYATRGCPSCACEAYVKSDRICTPDGACGGVLNGTGCAGSGYYGREPFFCGGDARTEAACMLRRMMEWGTCAPVAEGP